MSPGLTAASVTHNPSRLTTNEDSVRNATFFSGRDLAGRAQGSCAAMVT